MAKDMVSIQYQFIFSKEANIWGNIFEFEKNLQTFFQSNGLEASAVNLVTGSTGGRVILISKIPQDKIGTLQNKKGIQLTKQSPKDNPLFRVRKSSTIINRMTDSLGKKKKKK